MLLGTAEDNLAFNLLPFLLSMGSNLKETEVSDYPLPSPEKFPGFPSLSDIGNTETVSFLLILDPSLHPHPLTGRRIPLEAVASLRERKCLLTWLRYSRIYLLFRGRALQERPSPTFKHKQSAELGDLGEKITLQLRTDNNPTKKTTETKPFWPALC